MRNVIIGLFLFLLLVSPALAQTGLVESPPITVVKEKGAQGVLDLINKLSGWLFRILSALAVAFIIWAAYGFLTSGGDETKVKEAKNRLVYALVAFIIGLLSWSLVLLISGFFDKKDGGEHETSLLQMYEKNII